MSTPQSITIRTPKSSLQPHHTQSSMSVANMNGLFYFYVTGVDGRQSQLWISENQARWLERWLRRILPKPRGQIK